MTIFDKLNEIQTTLNAPKSLDNKFGGYKYRSKETILEALKQHLKDHGLTLTIDDQMIDVGGRVYCKSTAALSDGENIITATGWAREAETRKGMDDAQLTGATSSYAGKYALGNLFCIDDTKDADATNDHGKKPATKAEVKTSTKITKQQATDLWNKAKDAGWGQDDFKEFIDAEIGSTDALDMHKSQFPEVTAALLDAIKLNAA